MDGSKGRVALPLPGAGSDVLRITCGIIAVYALRPGLKLERTRHGSCLGTAGYKLFFFSRGGAERRLGFWGGSAYFFAQPRITSCAAGVP